MKQQLTMTSLVMMLLILPSLGVASFAIQTTSSEAVDDIKSKLEYCQKFNKQKERKECLKQVRKYCRNNYPNNFCKKAFKHFLTVSKQ